MKPEAEKRIVQLAQLKKVAWMRRQAGKISLAEYEVVASQLDSLSQKIVGESPAPPLEELVGALEQDSPPVPLKPFRRWLQEDIQEREAASKSAATPAHTPPPPLPNVVEVPKAAPLSPPQSVDPLHKQAALVPTKPLPHKADTKPEKPGLPVLEEEPEFLEASAPKLAVQDRLVQQQSGWNKYLKPFLSENWMGVIGAVSLTAAWLLLAMWLYGQGRLSGFLIGAPPLAIFTLATAWLCGSLQKEGSKAAPTVVVQFGFLSFLSIPFHFMLAAGLAIGGGAAMALAACLAVFWIAPRLRQPLGHDPTVFLLSSNALLFVSAMAGLRVGGPLFFLGGFSLLVWRLLEAAKVAQGAFPIARSALLSHFLISAAAVCLLSRTLPEAGLVALLLQPAAWAIGRFWTGLQARLAAMGLSLLGILLGLNSPTLLPLVVALACVFWFLQWKKLGEGWALEIASLHLPVLTWALADVAGMSGTPLLWTMILPLAAISVLESVLEARIRSLTLGWPLFAALVAAAALLNPLSGPIGMAPLLVLVAGSAVGYRALIRQSGRLWLFNLVWTPACLYLCLLWETPFWLFLSLLALSCLAISSLVPHPLARRSSASLLWCYSLAAGLLQVEALSSGSLDAGHFIGTLAALIALSGLARRTGSALPVYLSFLPVGLLAFRLAMEWGIRLESGLGSTVCALAVLACAAPLQGLLGKPKDQENSRPAANKLLLVSQDFVLKPFENISLLLAGVGLLRALFALAPLTLQPKLALALPLQILFWTLMAWRRREAAFTWVAMAPLLGFAAALIWSLGWDMRPTSALIALAVFLMASERMQSPAHPLARIISQPLRQTSLWLLYAFVPLGLVADWLLTAATPVHAGLQALLSAALIHRFLVRRSDHWSHLVLTHLAIFWGWSFWVWRIEIGGHSLTMTLDLLSATTLLLMASSIVLAMRRRHLLQSYAKAARLWLALWFVGLALSLLCAPAITRGTAIPALNFCLAVAAAAAAAFHLRYPRALFRPIAKEAGMVSKLLRACATATAVFVFWSLSIRLIPVPGILAYIALVPALYKLARLQLRPAHSRRRIEAACLLAVAAAVAICHPLFESLFFPNLSLAAAAPLRHAPAFLMLGLAALRLNRHWPWAGFSLGGTSAAAAGLILGTVQACQALGLNLPQPAEAAGAVFIGHLILALLFLPNPLRAQLQRFAGLASPADRAYRQQAFLLAAGASQISIPLLLLFDPGNLTALPFVGLAMAGPLYAWRRETVPLALLEAAALLSLAAPILYPQIDWRILAAGLCALLSVATWLRRQPVRKDWIPDKAFLAVVGLLVIALLQGGLLRLDSFAFLLFAFLCWALIPDRPFNVEKGKAHYLWIFWSGYFWFCWQQGYGTFLLPAWSLSCTGLPLLLRGVLKRTVPPPKSVLHDWKEKSEQAVFELSLAAVLIAALGFVLEGPSLLFDWPWLAALEAVVLICAALCVRRAVRYGRLREQGRPTPLSPVSLATLGEVLIISALGLLRWKAELSELLQIGSVLDGYLLLGLAAAAAGIREVLRRNTRTFDRFLSRASQLYALIGWALMLLLDYRDQGALHGFSGSVIVAILYAWRTRQQGRSSLIPSFAFANAALFLLFFDFDLLHPLFYIFPVASSVLILAHLLRERLSHRQKKNVRLACSIALLGSSAFYNLVAFQDSFGYPLVAAMVALLGVLAGISLRIRIYLYLGTFFFVFNTLAVLIQMARYQPAEHIQLLVGLLFLVTGLLFTAGFWAFQTQRHAILQRYEALMGELEDWE